MFYPKIVWDPWLIVVQVVCLQCLHYLTLGFFMTLLIGARVPRMSLAYYFDPATLNVLTDTGRDVIASFVLTAIAGAVYLLLVVERSRKCLDFSATLYIIHVLICVCYGGWPSSTTWWAVNGIGVGVMTLLGEYLCICRRELQEIKIPVRRYSLNV